MLTDLSRTRPIIRGVRTPPTEGRIQPLKGGFTPIKINQGFYLDPGLTLLRWDDLLKGNQKETRSPNNGGPKSDTPKWGRFSDFLSGTTKEPPG